MSYLYKYMEDCIASQQHLISCDADGYCTNCGEQAEDVTAFAVPTAPDTKPYDLSAFTALPTPSEFAQMARDAGHASLVHGLDEKDQDTLFEKLENPQEITVTPAFEGVFEEAPAMAPIFEPLPDQPYTDFIKFDIRTGTITKAEKIKKKDKLVHLEVWLGSDIGSRTIVAGIAQHFAVEFLVGTQVMVVTNLEPRKLGGFISHGMILAGMGPNGLSLAGCMGVPDGCEIG